MTSRLRMNAAAAVAVAIGLAASAPAAVGAELTYNRVVRSGEAAPGTPAGVTFGALFDPPSIGPTGEVGFGAMLQGAGVNNTNDFAYFVGDVGAIGLLARAGEPAPGTDTTYVRPPDVSRPRLSINAANQTVFLFQLSPSSEHQGLWTGRPGAVTLIGQSGGQVPDAPPGVRFTEQIPPFPPGRNVHAINESGQVAFFGELTDGQAIFAGAPGSIRIVARSDQPAPGVNGMTFRFHVARHE
jgi:hypothetical protein